METITAKTYKQNIAAFFQLSDLDKINEAAKTQMRDFTQVHHSPKGVFCLEEDAADWFRMTEAEYAKI